MQSKDIREVIDGLVLQGCEISRTTKGWMVYMPDGSNTTFHGTPSDPAC